MLMMESLWQRNKNWKSEEEVNLMGGNVGVGTGELKLRGGKKRLFSVTPLDRIS